jgi:hypothetical protein
MAGLRSVDVEYRDHECMDLTSLTQDEFAELLLSFEAAFQERMRTYRLDGQQRTGRGYVTYDNCPLPTCKFGNSVSAHFDKSVSGLPSF